jgi:hypothetical protein
MDTNLYSFDHPTGWRKIGVRLFPEIKVA